MKNKNMYDIPGINMESIISNLPGYVYWKNKKSVFIGCNQLVADISHLKSPNDIIGKTDFDLDWSRDYADELISHDKYVMKTGKTHISEQIISIPGSISYKTDSKKNILKTQKSPLVDQNGSIIGVFAIAQNISNDLSYMLQYLNNKVRNELDDTEDDSLEEIKNIKLSKRQHEILYLLMFGKSPRFIAEFISSIDNKKVTQATVTSIINKQLYRKFKVTSATKLIERAILLKVTESIPSDFIP